MRCKILQIKVQFIPDWAVCPWPVFPASQIQNAKVITLFDLKWSVCPWPVYFWPISLLALCFWLLYPWPVCPIPIVIIFIYKNPTKYSLII